MLPNHDEIAGFSVEEVYIDVTTGDGELRGVIDPNLMTNVAIGDYFLYGADVYALVEFRQVSDQFLCSWRAIGTNVSALPYAVQPSQTDINEAIQALERVVADLENDDHENDQKD